MTPRIGFSRHTAQAGLGAKAAAEPGFDHTNLTGATLKAKLKEHKIGLLRTKEELVKLLAEKQTALKQAQQLAEQLKKVPAGGLQDLTVVELKEMAKAISLKQTRQDVIDLLDKLEPGVDHSNLSGKALQKVAGEELAEKAKKDKVETARNK